jgi:hypothetical protein
MLRHPLARDIAVILAIKFLLMAAIFFAFFGPRHRVAVSAEGIQQHLFHQDHSQERFP